MHDEIDPGQISTHVDAYMKRVNEGWEGGFVELRAALYADMLANYDRLMDEEFKKILGGNVDDVKGLDLGHPTDRNAEPSA